MKEKWSTTNNKGQYLLKEGEAVKYWKDRLEDRPLLQGLSEK